MGHTGYYTQLSKGTTDWRRPNRLSISARTFRRWYDLSRRNDILRDLIPFASVTVHWSLRPAPAALQTLEAGDFAPVNPDVVDPVQVIQIKSVPGAEPGE